MWAGEQTPEETLDKIAERVNKLIQLNLAKQN